MAMTNVPTQRQRFCTNVSNSDYKNGALTITGNFETSAYTVDCDVGYSIDAGADYTNDSQGSIRIKFR